jgi:hypothetical protein
MARHNKFDKLHAIILRESKELETMRQTALLRGHNNIVNYKEYHGPYQKIKKLERRDNVG